MNAAVPNNGHPRNPMTPMTPPINSRVLWLSRAVLALLLAPLALVLVATPGHNAAPKPVAGGRIDRMWHIAPDRTPFAAINCGRQVNFTRPVAGKTIGSLSRTRSIRPGELQFIELDVDRLRRRFPACLGL